MEIEKQSKVKKIIQQKKNYQLGDCVLFKDLSGEPKIGRIEDYNMAQGWYECFVYLTPEQTPLGRQSHHGVNEIFKTKGWERFTQAAIINQVQVVKNIDYQKLKEKNELTSVFIVRQDYDSETQTFLPALQKCICGKQVNPDDTLIFCDQCEKAFCANCLKVNLNKQPFYSCDYCRNDITEQKILERYEVFRKSQKNDPEPLVRVQSNHRQQEVLEISDELEDEEIDLKKQRPVIDLDKLAKKIKKNDSSSHQVSALQKGQEKDDKFSVLIAPKDQKLEKKNSQGSRQKQFKNFSQEKIDKINHMTEMYRLQETIGPNIPKKRLEVREKMLQLLLFGIEELKELQEQNPNDFSKNEKNLIQSDDQIIFSQIKKLVLEIEVTLHMKYNLQRHDYLDPKYIERCKLIYFHLKDEKNFELRRKVLNKEFTANDLANKDERELYNPEKRQETLLMTKISFDLDQKVNTQQNATSIEEEPELFNVSKNKNNQLNDPQNPSHIQSDIYKSVQEFLPSAQVARIQRRLQTELRKENSEDLIKHLQMLHKV